MKYFGPNLWTEIVTTAAWRASVAKKTLTVGSQCFLIPYLLFFFNRSKWVATWRNWDDVYSFRTLVTYGSPKVLDGHPGYIFGWVYSHVRRFSHPKSYWFMLDIQRVPWHWFQYIWSSYEISVRNCVVTSHLKKSHDSCIASWAAVCFMLMPPLVDTCCCTAAIALPNRNT